MKRENVREKIFTNHKGRKYLRTEEQRNLLIQSLQRNKWGNYHDSDIKNSKLRN